jgi:hypothetical protein
MLVALEGLVVRGSGGLLREDRATNFATQRSKSCNGDLEELRRRDEGGIEREREIKRAGEGREGGPTSDRRERSTTPPMQWRETTMRCMRRQSLGGSCSVSEERRWRSAAYA